MGLKECFEAYGLVCRILDLLSECCSKSKLPSSAVLIAAVRGRLGMSLEGAEKIVEKYYRNELTVEEVKTILDGLENLVNDGRVEEEARKVVEEGIVKTIEEKGEDWVVAALFDGSLGYHTPSHARRLIRRFMEGHRKDWCERCLSVFDSKLDVMMYADITGFERVERRDPEKVRKLIEFVREVEKLDQVDQIGIGLMYPSMGV